MNLKPRWTKSTLIFGGAAIWGLILVGCVMVDRTIVAPPNVAGATFVGSKKCADCHDDQTKHFDGATHSRVALKDAKGLDIGCEACHGAGSVHVKAGGGKGFADKYSVFPMPVKEKSASFVGGSNLGVFKTTKNRDAAWKLVQWLAKPEVQVKWYKMSTDLPSVTSAWKDPALTADTKLATFGKQLETAVAPPSFATWEQVAARFDAEVEKVTKTGADVDASLKSVQSEAQSIGTGD